MGCTGGIVKAIVSDCTTQGIGGLEAVGYIFNRADLEITFSSTTDKENQITDLANAVGKKGYQITGVKKNINAGHDIVVADDRANRYTHHVMFPIFEMVTESIRNGDDLDDLIVIVESKDKQTSGDGTFLAYGCKYGLFKTADTRRANDVNGVRNIELASLPGQEEPYSHYVVLDTDYATTKALLVDLITNVGT